MEKNKIKYFIPIIIIAVLLFITAYKITKNREEKLYDVLYGKIEYAAKTCYLDKECEGKIVLQDLYDKNYIDIQYDPVTKEILDNKKSIELKDDKVVIEK